MRLRSAVGLFSLFFQHGEEGAEPEPEPEPEHGGEEAGGQGGEDGEAEGGDLTTQEAMAVHQLKFFSRTLSTGLFIIVWDNQVKVFYISRGRRDVSRGGQIIPTISIKSRNLLHFSRNPLPLYISRGKKPYHLHVSRGT